METNNHIQEFKKLITEKSVELAEVRSQLKLTRNFWEKKELQKTELRLILERKALSKKVADMLTQKILY